MLVLYPEPVDRAAFDEYYRAAHLPLCRSIPGISDIRFSLGLEGPYYGVFEASFESADAFRSAMASPEGRATAADVANYATGGATVIDYPVESA